jgi:hypothetical protein
MIFLDLVCPEEDKPKKTEVRKRRSRLRPWVVTPVTPDEYAAMLSGRAAWVAWDESQPDTKRVSVAPHHVHVYSERDPAKLREDAASLNAIADWLEREPKETT